MSGDVTAWLDGLAAAHKAATPGPWVQYDLGDGMCWESPIDTAAIVAAHNALPALIAAVRRVFAVHKPFTGQGGEYCDYDGFVWPCVEYRAVTAAIEMAS